MKFVVIERGRLDKESMNVIFGGKKWENCSDSGTACPMVSGNGFTIIKECFYLPICHGRCPHQRIQEELGSVERQPCMKDTKCINRYLEKIIENLSL